MTGQELGGVGTVWGGIGTIWGGIGTIWGGIDTIWVTRQELGGVVTPGCCGGPAVRGAEPVPRSGRGTSEMFSVPDCHKTQAGAALGCRHSQKKEG